MSIKLKNNTGSLSKIGYAVSIDTKDPYSFIYSTPSSTKVIGIITEQVPYRSMCTIATAGEKANAYVNGNVVKGNSIRLSKTTDRTSLGTCMVAKVGDSPYVKIGDALSNGRGLVPCLLELQHQGTDDSGYLPYQNATRDTNTGVHGITTNDLSVGGASNNITIDGSGEMVFNGTATVWDDLRITPGSFDRPGASDPAYVLYYPSAGGLGTYSLEFAKNNVVSFIIQLPHSYKEGSSIYAHAHWTPGDRGNEENGATVGWKIDYSWTNRNGVFPIMQTLDLSDACDGVDHKHQITPEVEISGVGKTMSSMLICNLRRSDTGADDTWAGTAAGQLPILLEVDFHVELSTVGSKTVDIK